MTNKHKNSDLIIAKSNNMDLVLFGKYNHESEYKDCSFEKLIRGGCDVFLCLPQHKEACLHWLNGGKSQYLSKGTGNWIDFGDSKDWIETHLFMTNGCEIRIKPRKEKRWIAYNKENGNVYGAYLSEDGCKVHYPELPAHEIEVQV